MSDIFHKTTIGYEEIVSRAHGLSPRLRRCLILIDGKRGVLELATLLQGEDVSTLIQALELDGYIELTGLTNDRALASKVLPSQSNAVLNMDTTVQVSVHTGFQHSQPLFKDSNGQLRQPLPFKERQLRASRVINELLGPNAEGIALKIESCKDDVSLEIVLKMAAAFITDTVNTVAAKRFRDHVRLTHVD
jgi:hypothetical protein